MSKKVSNPAPHPSRKPPPPPAPPRAVYNAGNWRAQYIDNGLPRCRGDILRARLPPNIYRTRSSVDNVREMHLIKKKRKRDAEQRWLSIGIVGVVFAFGIVIGRWSTGL